MNTVPLPSPVAVPDHELLRCVGQGSYGEVWLARNIMGSFRGVKIIRRDRFQDERPFEREFEGIQKYEPVSRTHPGLVAILHVGRGSGWFYYVMEVADDQQTGQRIVADHYAPKTLRSELLQRGRLPVTECVRLGLALTAALAHLHQQGLIHRDIKPANIIFVQGQPKFADIGLVAALGERATSVGTEGYMAPEGPGAAAADIYSLGKVLYEISSGKSCEAFPELPTGLRQLPEAAALLQLNKLVLRACAPQPDLRFASADVMRAALAKLDRHSALAAAGPIPSAGAPPSRISRIVLLNPARDAAVEQLARRLDERLTGQGLEVFLDQRDQPSVLWGRELEGQIGEADVVLALLSPATEQSPLLAYGIELALQGQARRGGPPRLAAVRLGGTRPWSKFLASALAQAELLEWTGPGDDARLVAWLSQARSPGSLPES